MPIIILFCFALLTGVAQSAHAEHKGSGYGDRHQRHHHARNEGHHREGHHRSRKHQHDYRRTWREPRSGRGRHHRHSLPHGVTHLILDSLGYYYLSGIYYYREPEGYVTVAAPLGAIVPDLPVNYRRFPVRGQVYYVVGNTYYVRVPGGYKVVEPVSDRLSERTPVKDFYIYPARGQNEETQEKDRYQCHRWGKGQTGYDPAPVQTVYEAPQADAYRRAVTACLEARGYTVK